MAHPNAHVPAPELTLTEDTPVSAAFGDVYFSRGGGVAETSHVFLAGNGLPQRWAAGGIFTIAELGFGTGLNFLVTLKRFREAAAAGTTLQYLAVEKFPFTREQLRAVLALQPELAAEAAELLAAYPLRLPGAHRLTFGAVRLTLFFGEVGDWLQELNAPIDAWYLDGFSPAKNADMWGDDVLARIGKLSAPGTTFATFTAAGFVKRGLEAAGFAVEKVPGFGRKREMLRGVKQANLECENLGSRKANVSDATVLVMGAGIAGATLARALAERGYRVTVIERGTVAIGASGNAAGVLFPPLQKQWNAVSAFYFTAYGFMLRSMARWKHEGLDFASASPGMLRLPRQDAEELQLRMLSETLGLDAHIVHWLERDAASDRAGVALATGAAFFPEGSWISPPDLCRALLQHPAIMLREQTAAKSLARADNAWVVTLAEGEPIKASTVCVATASDTACLLADYGLRLNEVGGQVTEFAADDAAPPLRSILCHKGYVIPGAASHGEPRAAGVEGGVSPPSHNSYLTGATYHREDMLAVTEERHAENMAQCAAMLPGWAHGEVMGGRSATRATTPDRLPYIGAIDAGLYVSAGHGSRGLLSAPLAAEMIASMITGEVLPLTRALQTTVSPLRFAAK